MIASLYQRGSIGFGLPASGGGLIDHEDMGDAIGRIELHEVPLAAPCIAPAVEQVFHHVAVTRVDAHLPDRHLDPAALRPMRVGIHADENASFCTRCTRCTF